MDSFINHFQEYLILGLLGALFFKETLTVYVRGVLGLKDKENVPLWGQKLTQYANHETSAKLDKLIAMEEKEHEQADRVRESLRGIDHTLGEFREYGIRIRKD